MEKRFIEFEFELEYFNKKRLCLNDFLNEMNKEFLSFVSKNRGFIDEDENEGTPLSGNYITPIDFIINYYTIKDDDEIHYFHDDCLINLDKGILLNYGEIINYPDFNDIWEVVIWWTNIQYDENYEFGVYHPRDELKINNINEIIIVSLKIKLHKNIFKLNHKKKFYKSLYDDLMKVAWHPSRYLDWCIDVEELKFLEELWGDED